uniref:Uncharacterized protein n=1 Tax=Ficedula albicollis TaxID=59894 RepID=A0A803VD28_FICAL
MPKGDFRSCPLPLVLAQQWQEQSHSHCHLLGKHLLLSQPALLPGRWLAHSRNACGCWPRWPIPEQALPAWSQGMTHRPHSIISGVSLTKAASTFRYYIFLL